MDNAALGSLTMCFAKAGLGAGTTTTICTTTTVPYILEGIWQTSKTAITNGATPTTDWSTGNAFIPIPIPLTTTGLPAGVPSAAGYACAYVVGLDNAGTVRVIQGPIVGLDSNGNFISAAPTLNPSWGPNGPNPGTIAGGVAADNNFCPIGFIVVKLGSTAVATWTFGTNNLSSVTGVTYIWVDCATLPDQPQVA